MAATKKKASKAPTQVVGNVGLYYVCYRLALLGWNVMPTSRNARGIDILCYSQDGKRTVTIQVKALSKRSPVPLGHSLDHLIANFVVVVRNAAAKPPAQPQSFILTPEEVGEGVHVSKDGKDSHWLQPREYEGDAFHEAWGRIGEGN